jgi:CheY-like chemotaxis protein
MPFKWRDGIRSRSENVQKVTVVFVTAPNRRIGIMEEKTSFADEAVSAGYDTADKPFDFISANNESALVCEEDPTIREKVSKTLINMGYHVSEPVSEREALKSMRFHAYDLVVINENFALESGQTSSEVLSYLQNLAAATRRNTFVVLLADNYRTMDNMMAFNKSVNLIINKKNIDDFAAIVKRGLDENKAFYGIFKEVLKKIGRI